MRKFIVVGITLVVLLGLAGGAYWFVGFYPYFKSFSGLPTIIYGNANPSPGTNVITEAKDTPYLTPGGMVTAITPTSITVTGAGNQTKTYTVSTDTNVYSLVSVGHTGRTYADIATGTKIVVYPARYEPTKASGIAFTQDLLTKGVASSSVNGTITTLTSSTMTIDSHTSAPVEVVFDSSTQVLASVKNGETAHAMRVGDRATAIGPVDADGKLVAKFIVFITAVR